MTPRADILISYAVNACPAVTTKVTPPTVRQPQAGSLISQAQPLPVHTCETRFRMPNLHRGLLGGADEHPQAAAAAAVAPAAAVYDRGAALRRSGC